MSPATTRISRVTVTPVAFADPPLLNSVGVHEPFALRAIVRVDTDEGLVGWGETYADDVHLQRLGAVAAALPGHDAFETERLRQVVAAVLGSGTDGGEWGEALTPDQLVAQTRRMIDGWGFPAIKLKGGVLPPDDEIEATRALAAAFPGVPLRLDPNAAWTPETGIRVAKALALPAGLRTQARHLVTTRRSRTDGCERVMSVTTRTSSSALRQAAVFLAIAYVLALAIALALPRAGIAPLISILVPVIAVAITVLVTLPRGERRAVWADVGFGRPSWRALLVAVVGAVVILTLSFGIAAALGVVRFAAPDGGWVLELLIGILAFGVILLGEEIGWRGFLLLRFGAVMSGRRAALATGACQAAFHLPLLTLTTTYQSEGNRWIVVPIVMVTLTLAGVWYAWLRLWSGSIWPVSLSHSTFNNVLDGGAGLAITTSPAAMAYTTTETGVVTLLIVVVTAVFLLTRRAADFRLP